MINFTKMIQASMKAQEKEHLVAYRSIKKKETELETSKNFDKLTEQHQFAIIKKEIKERKETVRFYIDRGTPENPEVPFNNIIAGILEDLLPKQLTEQETIDIITSTISEVNASSMKQMGQVIKKIKGSGAEVDMSFVSSKVKEILSGN